MEEPLCEELEFVYEEFSTALISKYPKKKKNGIITGEKLRIALEEVEIEKTVDDCLRVLKEHFEDVDVDVDGKKDVTVDLFLTRMRRSLSPTEFVTLEVIDNKKIAHDTALLNFVLPTPKHVSGAKFAEYLEVKSAVPLTDSKGLIVKGANAQPKTEVKVGKFTPITHPDKKQWMQIVVKRKQGLLSNHLFNLKKNGMVEFRGCFSQYKYKPKAFRRIGFLAAGTGITPFKGIIDASLSDKTDQTKMTLLYSNKTERDILFYKELKNLAKSRRFTFINTISESLMRSHFIKGHVNKCLIETFLPRPSSRTLILVCGPLEYNKNVEKILKAMDYPHYQLMKAE